MREGSKHSAPTLCTDDASEVRLIWSGSRIPRPGGVPLLPVPLDASFNASATEHVHITPYYVSVLEWAGDTQRPAVAVNVPVFEDRLWAKDSLALAHHPGPPPSSASIMDEWGPHLFLFLLRSKRLRP